MLNEQSNQKYTERHMHFANVRPSFGAIMFKNKTVFFLQFNPKSIRVYNLLSEEKKNEINKLKITRGFKAYNTETRCTYIYLPIYTSMLERAYEI